ncbi:hypothetical protein Pan216_21210 [Planctomycetes bacterium Pan216]|uniref:Uncharacterized protein n=1 Tax=Kolteria novifilia TaxID=2527975 RepID=A0A518B2Q2_9BACT|nr:hypothetical protein Pan216_21210 [Planctomycetes bacterium Pan216]
MNEKALADRAKELLSELGNIIEQLNDASGTVSLEVWVNGGGESMMLHQLTGEFTLFAGLYTDLTGDDERASEGNEQEKDGQ